MSRSIIFQILKLQLQINRYHDSNVPYAIPNLIFENFEKSTFSDFFAFWRHGTISLCSIMSEHI